MNTSRRRFERFLPKAESNKIVYTASVDVLLACPKNSRLLMTEFLGNRGLVVVDSGADYLIGQIDCIPEKHQNGNSEISVVLVYRQDRLNEFDRFLRDLGLTDQDKVNRPFNRDHLLGQHDDCFELIKISDVFFFKADHETVFCYLPTAKYEVKPKLYELEQLYREKGFVRISKSIVVNIKIIHEVVPWFGGRLLLRSDTLNDQLEVSRSYAKAFKAWLGMP